MSTRKPRPSGNLCRFAFADGRRCRMPAHPSHDGLCYAHGTLAPRASRQDNFLRELAPLSGASPTKADYRHAFRAISQALADGRVSPEHAAVLTRIGNLLRQSQGLSQDKAFQSGHGPAWDAIRELLDSPDTRPPRDS